ncbi:MAG: mannose-6-phosphate isomerase, class I [Lachnospiraceae bacterium]|nr:mannose-6-phosphate isomerase, class I [Lachnospiraceae bacterium]
MRELLFMNPVFKETIWGGDRLKKDYGYDIPSDHTGECWAISAHPNGTGTVASGTYAGWKLSELWDKHRELFGGIEGKEFPLLIKIIDAKADLSIQVHPDDAYAAVNENGSLGKTECWYILDCDPGADIIVGHNAKNHEEVEEMIRDGKWDEFIRVLPVHKGDFFQINPGTVHAIRTGTLILETQQSSDVTYRLYDYDRLQNGKPRELHIDKSIDVIKAPFVPVTADGEETKVGDATITKLVTCPFYSVYKTCVNGRATIKNDKPFVNVSILDGEGTVDGVAVKKGDHFIIPAGYGDYTLEGNMFIISSDVPR